MTKAHSDVVPPREADSSFDWRDAERMLSGLGSGINIAHEVVDRHVEAGRGGNTALICLGRRYERVKLSYADLAALSAQAAAVFHGLGVEPGDRVAVLLGRCADLYTALLGAWKAGAVACPLFGSFGPGPLKSRLELSEAKVLVVSESLYLRKIAAIRAALPGLRHVLLVGDDGGDPGHHFGCAGFRDLVNKAQPALSVATRADSPALLHFTSGTAGTPKGVVHPHRVVLAQMVSAKQVFDLGAGDVYWCTSDPGWVTHTAYALIAPLSHGCTVVVDEADVDPRRWYGILKDERVTVWYTTPTAIRLMMRFGAALARSYRENSLRIAASVGEPLNAEAVSWGEKTLGVPFRDTWWQTETGAIAVANRPDDARPGSMGRPLPGVEVAVVERQLSQLVMLTEVDAVGELALKADGPGMFSGYAGDEARTRAAFVDGWYLTGDLVRQDADGFLWFVGRQDDMIKSAGHTIGPFEVEGLLMEHPAVAEVGVVGRADPLLREVPVAFVSLNPGFEPGEALEQELMAFARQELGSAMAPHDVVFIESLPKTTTGKILRRALKSRVQDLGQEDVVLPPGPMDDE